MLFIYNIGIRLFGVVVYLSSFFKPKAKQWVDGRKNWKAHLKEILKLGEKRIWMHCASVGEFEQGRNLIEALKEKYPTHKIVLTFFSPSGYELRKNYEHADYVFYLPLDTKSNAKNFVQLVNPSLVIFVKYEFWFHYLRTLYQKNIPTIIISAAFRKEQPFFQWYGGLFKKMLNYFTTIFVQDEESKALIKNIVDENKIVVTGDTRYDRVLTIAANRKQLPLIESFISNASVLIAGSTWPMDERLLQLSISALPENWKIIIAPHEVNKERIEEIKKEFPQAILYSSLTNEHSFTDKKILIIDNIGMLSSLYYYGKIALVGGGFTKGGIHNILEPAVFGLPVVIGPVYKKFVEANLLVSKKYCFPVHNADECKSILEKLSGSEKNYQIISQSLSDFMREQTGATERILFYIQSNRLL